MARPARPEPKVFLLRRARRRGAATGTARPTSPTPPTSACWARRAPATSRTRRRPTRARGRARATPLVVAMLRDPVARAVSNWRFSTDNGFEKRRLEDALRDNLDGPAALGPRRARRSRRSPTSSAAATPTTSAPWFDALPGDDVTCCSSRSCSTTTRPSADAVRRGSASTRPSGRPTGRPGQRERRRRPRARPPTCVARLREYFAASDLALSRLLGRPLPGGRRPPTRSETCR